MITGGAHPLPQRPPIVSTSPPDPDEIQHAQLPESSALSSVPVHIPHAIRPDPVTFTPGIPPSAPITRATSSSSHTWTDYSDSNLPAQQSNEDIVIDEATRAQLHDWYLRAGPMAQGLRNLKKWRDGK